MEPGGGEIGHKPVHVRDISEAVGRIANVNPAVAQFLSESAVYVSADGRKLTVYAEGFGEVMLSSPDAKKHISEAFAIVKITDGRAEVNVAKKESAQSGESVADELGGLL